MDKKELRDTYCISDKQSAKLKGIVSLYDNGNLIFTKENMIVKSGREAIVSSLFEGESFKIVGAFLSSSDAFSTADMTIDNIGADIKVYAESDSVSGATFAPNTSDGNKLERKYVITLDKNFIKTNNNSNAFEVGSLGLLCRLGDDTTDILFSRVSFQKYTKKANSTLTFTYTLYF